MRVFSRELFVGFLLVLVLGASGCQPVQPVSEASPTAVSESVGESATITTTEVISEGVVESATAPTVSLTASVTAPVTDSLVITATSAMSESAGDVAGESTADPELIAAGLTIYRAQYCGVCHTLDAAETRGTFGPTHNGMGATAATRLTDGTYQGAGTTPAEYIHESIVDPQAYTVPGYAATSHRMPVYAHLDSASIDALVAFLLAQ